LTTLRTPESQFPNNHFLGGTFALALTPTPKSDLEANQTTPVEVVSSSEPTTEEWSDRIFLEPELLTLSSMAFKLEEKKVIIVYNL
jgi:hypothetical protein